MPWNLLHEAVNTQSENLAFPVSGTFCTSPDSMYKSQCQFSKAPMIHLKGRAGKVYRLFVYSYSKLHRLVQLYQSLYDSVHAKSGQETSLKLQYIQTEFESTLAWV